MPYTNAPYSTVHISYQVTKRKYILLLCIAKTAYKYGFAMIVAQLSFRYSSNSFYMNIKQKCDNEIINTILLTLNYKYTVWIFVYIFHSYIICPTNILARKDFNITIIENWFELHIINSNINRYIVFKSIWIMMYKKRLLTISYNQYLSRCKRKFKYISKMHWLPYC